MSDITAALTLPGGAWYGENCCRNVTVRSLCGDDERFWLDLPDHWSLPQRVTALLERVVGWQAQPPPSGVAGLAIGDREALLLCLRRLSFGAQLQCVLNCPQCGEKLDLDLHADDLLLPPYQHWQPHYEAQLGDGYHVCFRLPTGVDQAQVAALARVDLEAAEQALIDRCVTAVTYQGQGLDSLPESLKAPLAERMAQLDPQAELHIQMVCPACETAFSTLLDMAEYLAAELANHQGLLDREVHTLALYYHWSEAEILHLPARRRQTYLRLLDEAFGERGLG
jgi:hypothetical protein